ncbi:MAG: hypothetical protein ACLPYB_14370 [Desulfobaccales bacterium]
MDERPEELFQEETATAEATSTVIMIAAVGVLLATAGSPGMGASTVRLAPPAKE